MNVDPAIQQHYLDGVATLQPRLAGHDQSWLKDRRNSAISAFTDLPYPHRKLEAWRYTSANALLEHRFQPVH